MRLDWLRTLPKGGDLREPLVSDFLTGAAQHKVVGITDAGIGFGEYKLVEGMEVEVGQ